MSNLTCDWIFTVFGCYWSWYFYHTTEHSGVGVFKYSLGSSNLDLNRVAFNWPTLSVQHWLFCCCKEEKKRRFYWWGGAGRHCHGNRLGVKILWDVIAHVHMERTLTAPALQTEIVSTVFGLFLSIQISIKSFLGGGAGVGRGGWEGGGGGGGAKRRGPYKAGIAGRCLCSTGPRMSLCGLQQVVFIY